MSGSDVEDAYEDAGEPPPPESRAGIGRLSMVATPIGNLEDITLRALRVLKEADVVLAEDTRRTRVLCERHGIHRSLRAFHAHSSERDLGRVLAELAEGKHVALVTDAGTPIISDPGAELVRKAHAQGNVVESIPGASAVTSALIVSGIPCDRFRFVGFLPRGGQERRDALADIAADRCANVIFESPMRLRDTLRDLEKLLEPDRTLAVCRELTKLHEEVARGTASALITHFEAGVRGEITLVIAGRSRADAASDLTLQDAELDQRIVALLTEGTSVRDTVRALLADSALSKHALYARVQDHKAKLQGEIPNG